MDKRPSTPVPDQLQHGIDLFNKGEYFEAHEVLEHFWRSEPDPNRQFTQALIQIAVGTYHLNRGNFIGAAKLFRRALKRAALFPDNHLGFDLAALVRMTEQLLFCAESGRSADSEPTLQRLSLNGP